MPFKAFVEELRARPAPAEGRPPRGIPYLSYQNDSLRTEMGALLDDIEEVLPLAREAFGNAPEAINLWMGDERSSSAMHKDPFENMYAVIRGAKRFHLLPPAAAAFFREADFAPATYQRQPTGGSSRSRSSSSSSSSSNDDEKGFVVVKDPPGSPDVTWVATNPLEYHRQQQEQQRATGRGALAAGAGAGARAGAGAAAATATAGLAAAAAPWLKHARPVIVDVGPGETLYLPALWWHEVNQAPETIAVNFWHDMSFDMRYVFFNLASRLGSLAAAPAAEQAQQQQEQQQEESKKQAKSEEGTG
eukprot:g2851.t1